MKIGIGLSIAARAKNGSVPDAVIKMLAVRVQGPGYNTGSAPPTGDGTTKTYTSTLRNDSGTNMQTCSVVLQGWTLRTTGTTDASASFDVTGTVEYPDGTTVGSIPSTTVTPGANVESADIILSTPVPDDATLRVRLSATPANGATYIANLGFAGIRNHALRSTLKKVCIGSFGDSINTNNSGAFYNAGLTRCGVYINSISGTTAETYGASSAANFAKQTDLCQKLGITHVVSNFGTNDTAAGGATQTNLRANLEAMRDKVRAAGMKFVQATMLCRTSYRAAISASAMTASGNDITVTVPDASLFEVGQAYTIAGANETGYNGNRVLTARDTGLNTLTFKTLSVSATPATGTITVRAWKATNVAYFMPPSSSSYDPGGSSFRGLHNAYIRSGVFDDYIEWADAMESSRDSGRWKVGGEDALLPAIQTITISSVISTSRFNSNYSRGSSTIPNGFVQAITGNNIGDSRSGNGNTNGDITVSSAWTNTQQVGDTLYAVPGTSYISDDGTHPRVSGGGTGGQSILDAATAAWLDAKLA